MTIPREMSDSLPSEGCPQSELVQVGGITLSGNSLAIDGVSRRHRADSYRGGTSVAISGSAHLHSSHADG